MTRTLAVILTGCCLALAAQPAVACTACFGDPDSPQTQGASNAVLFLLGVIGLVQVGFVGLFLKFRLRSKSLEERKKSFRLLRGGMHS